MANNRTAEHYARLLAGLRCYAACPENARVYFETVPDIETNKETLQKPGTAVKWPILKPSPETNDIETVARVGDTLGYARVSTHDQNPDAQRDRLIEAGAIRVFTDIVSGQRFDRPALAKLIDHARPGDRLCIIRLDRLGRSLRELLETVDDLKTRGIHLISIEERLDTSSAPGELVFHVFGSIARFERRLISERTRDGIAAARKRGRTPGRPPLDPETVSAAQKFIEAGLSPARTAKQLGIGRQRLTGLQSWCVEVETEAFRSLRVILRCAVRRRQSSAGANPVRQLSLQPVAVGADDGGNNIV